jgi:hypothetical protein
VNGKVAHELRARLVSKERVLSIEGGDVVVKEDDFDVEKIGNVGRREIFEGPGAFNYNGKNDEKAY